MKTRHTNAKFIEWLSPDEMHEATKKWQSELDFHKDEQSFLEELIRSYTLQILDTNHFKESKRIIESLSKIVKQTQTLITVVNSHEKKLTILVDGIDQIQEEKAYKKEHRNLIELISEYSDRYQTVKTELFNLIKDVMKKSKQNHRIDKT